MASDILSGTDFAFRWSDRVNPGVGDQTRPADHGVLGVKASHASNIVDPTLGVQAAHNDDSRLKGLVECYLKATAPRV